MTIPLARLRPHQIFSLALLVIAPLTCSGQVVVWDVPTGATYVVSSPPVGDVDGDGFGDACVVTQTGVVLVFSGATGGLMLSIPTQASGGLTRSAAMLGDIDGDGTADFALASPSATGPGGAQSGFVSAVSARTGALLWRAIGGPVHFLGTWLTAMGDIDGDGIGDVLASGGGFSTTTAPGYAVALSGRTGALLHVAIPVPGSIGGGQPLSTRIDDLSGDGIADYALSTSPLLQPTPQQISQAVFVYSGASGALLGVLPPPDLVNPWGYAIGGGDFDGDGAGDFIVVNYSSFSTPNAVYPGGQIAAYSGATRQLLHSIVGPTPNSGYGYVADVFGDLNGDGRADFGTKTGYNGAGDILLFSGLDGSALPSIPFPPPPPAQGPVPMGSGLLTLGHGNDIVPDGRNEVVVTTLTIPSPNNWVARLHVFSLPPVPMATVMPLGVGCGASNPLLAMQPPVIGGVPWIGVVGASGSSFGYLYMSQQTAVWTPLGGNCTAYVHPPSLALLWPFVTDANGAWATQLAIPWGARNVGLPLRLQALLLPPSGPFEVTNALDLTLGF